MTVHGGRRATRRGLIVRDRFLDAGRPLGRDGASGGARRGHDACAWRGAEAGTSRVRHGSVGGAVRRGRTPPPGDGDRRRHPRRAGVEPLGALPFVRPASTSETAMHTAPRRGHGPEYLGIREYRPGDSMRHVHWASTARHGRDDGAGVRAGADPASRDRRRCLRDAEPDERRVHAARSCVLGGRVGRARRGGAGPRRAARDAAARARRDGGARGRRGARAARASRPARARAEPASFAEVLGAAAEVAARRRDRGARLPDVGAHDPASLAPAVGLADGVGADGGRGAGGIGPAAPGPDRGATSTAWCSGCGLPAHRCARGAPARRSTPRSRRPRPGSRVEAGAP